MSSISSGVGLLPRDLSTAPSSLVETVPSPSWGWSLTTPDWRPPVYLPCQTWGKSPCTPGSAGPTPSLSTCHLQTSGQSRSCSPGISYRRWSSGNIWDLRSEPSTLGSYYLRFGCRGGSHTLLIIAHRAGRVHGWDLQVGHGDRYYNYCSLKLCSVAVKLSITKNKMHHNWPQKRTQPISYSLYET